MGLPDGVLSLSCAFPMASYAETVPSRCFLWQNWVFRGSRLPQTSTKTSILCSKSPKTRVSKGKSAQKPRFCARNARKRGFRRPKKHKNPDFVLEMAENEGSGWQKRTKTSILCSKSPKTGVPKAKKAQKCRFCAREEGEWHREACREGQLSFDFRPSGN